MNNSVNLYGPAWSRGGSIIFTNSEGILNNCSFVNNSALINENYFCHGGSILFYRSNLSINDCVFKRNTLLKSEKNSLYGGAICIFYSNGAVSGCNFSDNNSKNGGDIHLESSNKGLSIINCVFKRDQSQNTFTRTIFSIYADSLDNRNRFIGNKIYIENPGSNLLVFGSLYYVESVWNFTDNCIFPYDSNLFKTGSINLMDESQTSFSFEDAFQRNCINPTDFFSPSLEFTETNEFQTNHLTLSNEFSQSSHFSKSAEFSQSSHFSKSIEFSKSNHFSKSAEFSKSNHFSKSAEFSQSNHFSKSIEFSQSNYFSKSAEFSQSNIFFESHYSEFITHSYESYFESESRDSSQTFESSFDDEEKSSESTHINDFTESFNDIGSSFQEESSSQSTQSFYFTPSVEFSSSSNFVQNVDKSAQAALTYSISVFMTFSIIRTVTYSYSNSMFATYIECSNENELNSFCLTNISTFRYFPYIIYSYKTTYIVTYLEFIIRPKHGITIEQLIAIICIITSLFFLIIGIIFMSLKKKNEISDDFSISSDDVKIERKDEVQIKKSETIQINNDDDDNDINFWL